MNTIKPWVPDPLEVIPNCLDGSLTRAVQILGTSPRTGDQIDASRLEYLRLTLAAAPVQQAGEADPNAPWLAEAHMLCSDYGIPQGHITERLAALRKELAEVRGKALEEAAKVCEAEDSGFADRFECADLIRALAAQQEKP